jgi:Ring finger domain
MDFLDTETDLYDLFGETGTCVVCQEDLKDGERVRSLTSCSHIFHAACIEPWFERKRECPLCRKSIGPPAEPSNTDQRSVQDVNNLLERLQQLYTGLQNFMNGTALTASTSQNYQSFFEIARSLLVAAPDTNERTVALTNVDAVELRMRYALSFCLVDGILRRFSTAAEYMPHRAQINTLIANLQVNGLRPVPIDTETRTALVRSQEKLRDECKTRFQITGTVRAVRNSSHVKNWATILAAMPELQQVWSSAEVATAAAQ